MTDRKARWPSPSWRALVVAGISGAGFLAIDAVYRATQGDWILSVGPWIAFAIIVIVFMLQLSALRQAARRRQERAGRALGDSMMLVDMVSIQTDVYFFLSLS